LTRRQIGGYASISAQDSPRRHRADFLIVLLMSILMLLGLVVIYSISPALTARINAAGNQLDQNHFMYRQLAYLGIGLAAFVIASFVPLEWWRKYRARLLVVALIASLLPIILAGRSLALCTNGACRWIDLGFVSIQPAEFLKLALLVFLAGFFAQRSSEGRLNNWQDSLMPAGVVLGLVSLIVIVLQKDLGTGAAIFGIAACMLFVSGIKKRYFFAVLAIVASASVVLVLTSPHRLERVTTLFGGSSSDKEAASYHISQALIAIGSGGIMGKGIGQSIQAFGYLPEAANDSIFAIVAEKFGFIGTLLIMVLFACLFLRLLKIMDGAANTYHRLLAAGIFGWVFTHTIINIGAMLSVLPLTGLTLPFLSFGGTSLVFMMAALGIMLQISRYTMYRHITDEGGKGYEDSRSRRRVGRPRYAGTGRY
jgi:cell division protein FtsW